jgi:uncharacterized protein
MIKRRKPKKVTSPYVTFKKSNIHSTGGFAKRDIRKGTKVIEYVGDHINEKEMERREEITNKAHKKNKANGAVYCFEMKKNHYIDGNVWYNSAKNLNHSCDPNCEADIIKGRIWILALRNIKKGEELTYNYGYELEDCKDHPCRCGADRCVGCILDETLWPKLKKTKR